MRTVIKTPSLQRIRTTDNGKWIAQIAMIHQTEIRGGFLPTLGSSFLRQLYEGIATSPETVLIAAVDDGDVIGFIAGAFSTTAFYKDFTRRYWAKLALGLFGHFATHPTAIFRCVETLRYPARVRSTSVEKAAILNFCVSSDLQGRGVGRLLFDAMMNELKTAGVNGVRIVTGADQRSAVAFYEHVGARKSAETEIHRHVKSIVFEYDAACGGQMTDQLRSVS